MKGMKRLVAATALAAALMVGSPGTADAAIVGWWWHVHVTYWFGAELDFDEITSVGVEPCAWHNGLFVVSCENVFLAACDENGYCS